MMADLESNEKVRSVADVTMAVGKLKEMTGDPETAHGYEDWIYIAVLHAIANEYAENPREMAREALKADDIKFERWYA